MLELYYHLGSQVSRRTQTILLHLLILPTHFAQVSNLDCSDRAAQSDIQQNVFWFDIPVDKSVEMHVLDALCYLCENAANVRLCELIVSHIHVIKQVHVHSL